MENLKVIVIKNSKKKTVKSRLCSQTVQKTIHLADTTSKQITKEIETLVDAVLDLLPGYDKDLIRVISTFFISEYKYLFLNKSYLKEMPKIF